MANLHSRRVFKRWAFHLIFLLCFSDVADGQIRYSIPEELERGAFVGNIAEYLGTDARTMSARDLRLVFEGNKRHFEVNLDTGILCVNERIDREQLCAQSPTCSLSFEVTIQNPLEIYRVEVEILDVNDNSPSFPKRDFILEVGESIAPGARFPLESAYDPDVGTNTIKNYEISSNECFGLNMQTTSDGNKVAELLLEKSLDRETEATFQLILKAIDGGFPEKSGTARIIITVLDANDNAPAFDQQLYKARLSENSPTGTSVATVNADDLDEGANAEMTYSFSNHASQRVRELFSLDSETGEITVQGRLDFEEAKVYELAIQATDNGQLAMKGHCKVLVEIIDVNDNPPEIKLTSAFGTVPENVAPGTVITLISVSDRDSGENGQVHCRISNTVPFKLQSSSENQYKFVTNGPLDRESTPTYNVTVLAWDTGSPPLYANKTICVSLSDVNDNAPRFEQPSYTVYLTENITPGASIFSLTALDPDLDANSYVTYTLLDSFIQGESTSAYISVNSNNGDVYALRSFDYEALKSFHIQVQARDAGVPPLSSSTTINVIILDQNDNVPVVISPLTRNGSVAVETVPRSAPTGYLVTRVVAADADSGQNSRLSYKLLKATDPSLFSVGLYSGEIRTTRSFSYQDFTTQSLIITIKDNGQPMLSASVTISFSIVENVTENHLGRNDLYTKPDNFSDLNVYLIITLASTSFIFLVAIVALVAVKCHQDRKTNYGCDTAICCWGYRSSRNVSDHGSAPNECLNYTGYNPGVYNYQVCLSPESAKSDFLFLRSYNSTLPKSNIEVTDHQSRQSNMPEN
uniref:Protocadherin epsilon17 n=1 Tax=Callorhinchus milii TaxID=7868 RepID=B0YN72_CALMI|nr:protocadherin epsilon17 [Callorhinchus milii]